MSAVRKGTYVLFITFPRKTNITAGALGPHTFTRGTYCYVGSAMGGLDQRLSRHLAHEKNIKWHIDYVTTVCGSCEAWESYPDFVPEGDLARLVVRCGGTPEIDRFGCSDRPCDGTHLFRVDGAMKKKIIAEAGLHRFRV